MKCLDCLVKELNCPKVLDVFDARPDVVYVHKLDAGR